MITHASTPAIRVLSVFGTRPEAIKMAPLITSMVRRPEILSRVCVTGQHRDMLDTMLALFDIRPDHDLDLMRPDQRLPELYSAILTRMGSVLTAEQPDWVLVHGDTTTALAAAQAAFYGGFRVAHIEAGLRSGNMQHPWPEEMNRRLVGALADFHFSPTERARENLLRENIPADRIEVTGNTVIDALLAAVAEIRGDPTLRARLRQRWPFLSDSHRLVLVTAHRRENLGEGLEAVCAALARLAERDDVVIVFPVHLNPHVQEPVRRILGDLPNVHLVEPLGYLEFVALLECCYLVITDSGGIQEEAPSLGKPVLVTRSITERPEAVEAGTVRLVGTDTECIVTEASRLLDDSAARDAMSDLDNPYGDGLAAGRISDRLLALSGGTQK